MTDDTINVTDHAVLRYLERVKGIDVEAARRELALDARTADAARQLGHVRIKRQGYKLIAENGAVVTVVTPESKREKYGNE